MNKPFYIFLDIDGVLNNEIYTINQAILNKTRYFCSSVPFDVRNIQALKYLIDNINEDVNIIISSTWRLDKDDMLIASTRLQEYGIKIKGKTSSNVTMRGEEIDSYCKKHKITDNYLIIDDDNDMLEHQLSHFIHCNSLVGLTALDAVNGLKLLRKEEVK